jgi:hypothetical protein
MRGKDGFWQVRAFLAGGVVSMFTVEGKASNCRGKF